MKSQKGDHVAKQKKVTPRKEIPNMVDQLGKAVNTVWVEFQKQKTFLVGLENLVMYLAEHLGEKEKFEEFIKEKLEEHKKETEESKADLPKEESK